MTYPELPHVGIKLFNRVYTHKSLHGPQYTLGQDYLRAPDDYERLAFVGAAALQLCVAQLACELHPKKVVGFLTVWRDGFICTDMLALWARAYGMPQYLKAAPGLGDLPARPKTAAALFEAYVGALVEHAGLPAAFAFVRELVGVQLALQPELRGSVLVHTPPSTPPPADGEQKELKTNPLELLNIHAAQTGRRIEWREEPHGPEHSKSWKMTLIIDGVVRGEGQAERKHKGKLVAAAQAWETIRVDMDR
ncbi:ribonuclease III [Auricularia subglabra TFB-10046 SS5]|nr:ribonuclease III [Auricularia subglabra TFB-10046 SS5]